MDRFEQTPILPTPQSQMRFPPSAQRCSTNAGRYSLMKLHEIWLVPARVRFVHAQVGVQVPIWRFDDAGDQVCHTPARRRGAFEWRLGRGRFVVDFVFVRHPGWAHDGVCQA